MDFHGKFYIVYIHIIFFPVAMLLKKIETNVDDRPITCKSLLFNYFKSLNYKCTGYPSRNTLNVWTVLFEYFQTNLRIKQNRVSEGMRSAFEVGDVRDVQSQK